MGFNLAYPAVQKFYRYVFRSVTLVAIAVTFQCCGNGVTRSESERLKVVLQLPEGQDKDLFWVGASSRILRWVPQKGGSAEIDWTAGASVDWDTREGDRIAFESRDGAGRVVVDGSAVVGQEKNVTIPLRRVL
jgi:hypothetical protein